MLTPQQVIPFLTDDRPYVRDQALRYFEENADPQPLSADHLWPVIDRFGLRDSLRFLRALDDVPQSEASYRRLAGALSNPPAKTVVYHLQRAFVHLDSTLLRAHADEVLGNERLPQEVRDHLRARLELADVPGEALWERLIAFGEQLAGKYAEDVDRDVAGRLVEALARTADLPLVDRVLAEVRGGRFDDSWTEIFLVQFLGRTRHHPAIDVLVEKLLIDEADILNEEAYKALGRIGTDEVIAKCEAAYPRQEWGVRLFAREPIHRIRRPAAAETLWRLLEREPDEQLQGVLLNDLCDFASLRGLDRARRLMGRRPDDPEMRGLREAVLAVAIMNGVELPEAADWTRRVEREHRRLRELMREMDEGFDEETSRGRGRLGGGWRDFSEVLDGGGGDGDDDVPYVDPLDAIRGGPVPIGAAPYRRDVPKVGRNDPCPCGSGKKYKKCCGG